MLSCLEKFIVQIKFKKYDQLLLNPSLINVQISSYHTTLYAHHDVHTTSITLGRRRMNVETESCAYREVLAINGKTLLTFLESDFDIDLLGGAPMISSSTDTTFVELLVRTNSAIAT